MVAPADVALWGKLGTLSGPEEELMQLVLDAIDAHLDARYDLDVVDDAGEVVGTRRDDPDVRLAVTMQAARLWKRRNSPEGVAGVGDLGVVTVERFDPDVDRLLNPLLRIGIA